MKQEEIMNQLIYPVLDEIREEQELDFCNKPDLALFGKSSVFDSLNLVNIILSVENKLADELGVFVTLASEVAMSRSKSPFKTVQSFAEYIEELLNETPHD